MVSADTPPSISLSERPFDLSIDFQKALRLMDGSAQNLFITGKAGTGKSTLLQYFRDHTQKQMAILAPTGVAAVNIKGQTIHSFFKFKPDVTLESIKKKRIAASGKKNIYQRLETLIVDEISMVRADLLDCMDKFLRLNGPHEGKPFGGVQLVFFGDLYQLAPVVSNKDRSFFQAQYKTPYFFSAQVMSEISLEIIELEKIYRQKDADFIDILNAIRTNTVKDAHLLHLNTRYTPGTIENESGLAVYLTTTNQSADAINLERLENLDGKYHLFEGTTSGRFEKGALPAPLELKIKVGAQIMLLNNDAKQRWVNGTMGKVLRISQHDEDYETYIRVELEDGKKVNIAPHKWELYAYKLENDAIISEAVGRYTQYPLTLAWGITIHKSQGKTFEHAVIDLSRGVFSPGQTYVALSRCTTLEGLSLRHPIKKEHIWTDPLVVSFLTGHQLTRANASLSINEKMYILGQAIEEHRALQITYLRSNGLKSTRTIEPQEVGEMTYNHQIFQGVKAYCQMAEKTMTFQVHHILDIQNVADVP